MYLNSSIYDKNREGYQTQCQTFQKFSQKGLSHINDSHTGPILPFVFNFVQSKDTLTLPVIGCYGVESSLLTSFVNRATFEALMRKMSQLDDIDFIISTGDQFYAQGVRDPDSPHFDYLHQQFSQGKLRDKIRMLVLGNHDYAMHHHSDRFNPLSSGLNFRGKIDRAFNQVEHTYRSADTWFMPYRYYAVTTQYATFFYLDSNTLPFDETQQSWFMQIYDATKEKPYKILVMHHPIRQHGKRGRNDYKDIDCYIPSEAMYAEKKLRETYAKYRSWNNLVKVTLQGLLCPKEGNDRSIHFILCAHDHFLAISRVHDLPGQPWQVLSGGGGGELSNIVIPPLTEECEKGSTAISTNGFFLLKISEKKISVECKLLETYR